MFSRSSKSSNGARRPAAPSIISADLRIIGNLESEGDIQIDGTVEGDIRSQKLTISETAVVRGAIEVDEVAIAGQLTGQIKARTVMLLRTAKVIADVIQEKLEIEAGAFFEGNCRHLPREEASSFAVGALAPPPLGRKPNGEAPVKVGNGAGKPLTAELTP